MGVVAQVRSMQVGLDTVHSAVSADLCMITTHEDHDDLVGYQLHEAHLQVSAAGSGPAWRPGWWSISRHRTPAGGQYRRR